MLKKCSKCVKIIYNTFNQQYKEDYELNLGNFNTKILEISAEANNLLTVMSNPTHMAILNDFIDAFNVLVEFVEDDKNINVLNESEIKNDTDIQPLDNISKNILLKLQEIELLLKKEIFDYLRPENNPSQDGTRVAVRQIHNSRELDSLKNKIKDQGFKNILSAFNILKHLHGHYKTLIILGPNGSGKTSLANHIKGVDNHVKVIPASKPIMATGYMPSIYNTTIENFNNEIYAGGILKEDLLQKLIVGICSEHDSKARKYYDTGVKEGDTTYEKVKRIFDDFFEVKLDNSSFGDKKIKAKKGGAPSFDFNNMSDGERVAFFYIATVIAAPKKSFIIVDEPENHLNPAIYNKIWDRLIVERNDCQFVFISHTMEFINARSNFELVKIKSFVRPNKFEFEFLGDTLDSIQSEFIVEIVGSRKPILFCEGSKADYDYKIYENLFGNGYTVIPTGNCASVENSVDACNMHATTYSIQSAIGIIDSDLKSAEEIERLRAKKVFSLKCNEIEMLLLDEAIFKKVLHQIYKPETEFEAFKVAFFNKLNERKQHIVKRLVKTQIDEKLRSSIIDDKNNKTKDEIKANLENIFNGLDVDALWTACDAKITDIIARKDYEEALRYCCLEHTEIIVGVGKRFVNDYATIALGVLGENQELSSHIRTKYFSEINN